MQNDFAAYVLALLSIPGVGRRKAFHILRAYPTASSLFDATSEERARVFKNVKTLSADLLVETFEIRLQKASFLAEKHREAGIRILTHADSDFPKLLKIIDDPPIVLFLKGNPELINSFPCVAVIGTRKPSRLGMEVARRVTGHLVEWGYTIVSGLAKGIDATAHEAALSSGGPTVAVLAEGLDRIYPAENRGLASRIVASGGALLSEYPIGKRALRSTFIERDRLQSGLSIALFPIQTEVKGGTMHTVHFAEKQGRWIACPIPIASEENKSQWAGIKNLIQRDRAWAFQNETYNQLRERLKELAGGEIDQKIGRINAELERQPPLSAKGPDPTEANSQKHEFEKETRISDASAQDSPHPEAFNPLHS